MTTTERDSKFTSEFMDEPIPQDQLWKTKYFSTRIRGEFLRYYTTFGSAIKFCEHTGFPCTERYLKKMKSELAKLEREHSAAKKDLDFELVAEIEMGELKLS